MIRSMLDIHRASPLCLLKPFFLNCALSNSWRNAISDFFVILEYVPVLIEIFYDTSMLKLQQYIHNWNIDVFGLKLELN